MLIVDDERVLRHQIRECAETLGYRAREAYSANAALTCLDDAVCDIAICDVRLDGVERSGVWLASQIRDRYPDTAVIMATASRDVEIAVASLRNQVVDYLLKPFDERRLGEALALGRDWHLAAVAQEDLHHALQDRLRARRAAVAGRARARDARRAAGGGHRR